MGRGSSRRPDDLHAPISRGSGQKAGVSAADRPVAAWAAIAGRLVGVGRCCMNRHWPARCPPTEFLPADAIRRWSAKGGHPIQDLTADDDLAPLPGWAPGAKTISDDGLVAEERVLHSALAMVP